MWLSRPAWQSSHGADGIGVVEGPRLQENHFLTKVNPATGQAKGRRLQGCVTPAYLRDSHVVASLLVGIYDWTRHGPQGGEALHVLVGEDGFALLPPLSQRHVQRFGRHNPAVHLCHGFCRLLWRRETDKTEASALGSVCHHLGNREETQIKSMILPEVQEPCLKNLCTGDGAVRGKLLPQPLIIYAVIQVLHIQIHTLEPRKKKSPFLEGNWGF